VSQTESVEGKKDGMGKVPTGTISKPWERREKETSQNQPKRMETQSSVSEKGGVRTIGQKTKNVGPETICLSENREFLIGKVLSAPEGTENPDRNLYGGELPNPLLGMA